MDCKKIQNINYLRLTALGYSLIYANLYIEFEICVFDGSVVYMGVLQLEWMSDFNTKYFFLTSPNTMTLTRARLSTQ